jgi:hypothetical protein
VSLQEVWQALKVIRDMLPEDHEAHQALQDLVWEVGEDLGECFG